MSDEIQAAGGVVVDDRNSTVLIVHRPRYDDWSLPKGHVDPGETFEQAALREVFEETGVRCELHEELEPARYDVKGRPKIVRGGGCRWSRRPTSTTTRPTRYVGLSG